MGVDVIGIKPTKKELGDYFGSNWWGWRPIQVLSETAIKLKELGFDTTNWGVNDGKGLSNQIECNKLADAIELLISNNHQYNENLVDDDDRIYIVMGSWCEVGTSKFICSEKESSLKQEYEYGSFLFRPIVMIDGTLVEPAYSVSFGELKEWLIFLRNCGGFKIW